MFSLVLAPFLWVFLFTFCSMLYVIVAAVAASKSLQSCSTLWNPIDGSPPGSPIPGILLARTLEWVAISFSNAWKWKVKEKSFSCVWLLATPWTAAHQAPLSMGLSRQEYWSGVPRLDYTRTHHPRFTRRRHARPVARNRTTAPSPARRTRRGWPSTEAAPRGSRAPSHPGRPNVRHDRDVLPSGDVTPVGSTRPSRF